MIDSTGQQPATDSWAFLLRIYADPGVADACLLLQAEAGVDVTFLLAVAYASAQRGIALSPVDITEMNTLCQPWREQIVKPLRALRVTLKSGPQPAPQTTEALRAQIKASELAAERLQNDLLADWLQHRTPASSPVDSEHARHILREAVAASGTPDPDINGTLGAAIDTIAAAAVRISR